MFFTLGLLVFPAALGDVAVEGTILAVLAAVVARPAAVYVATAWSGFRAGGAGGARLGGPARRGAGRAGHVPGAERGLGQPRASSTSCSSPCSCRRCCRGPTFEALARRLGVTTNEAAVPTPLAESGTMRSLGAEIVEFAVRAGDAVVGARVRELGLPRDALLNVIVRGEQAIPPRGSTRVEAGDRLHVLVRQEVAIEFRRAAGALAHRPGGREPPPRTRLPRSAPSIFTSRPWHAGRRRPARPRRSLNGLRVIQRLRTRRDVPGVLVELEDGRYAATGPRLMIGGSTRAARRRPAAPARRRDDAEAAWWREVIGALSAARG